MNNRIKYIDIARAFAMIIIIVGHTFVHSSHCSNIYYFFYSFNIALFFILSGYTFKVKNNFTHFFKSKFIRIMIPYFIWAFIFIIPYFLLGNGVSGSNQKYELFETIKNIFYGNGVNNALKQNTSLWFLPALFSMECIYYFIIKICNDNYDYFKLPILLIIGFMSSNLLSFYLPWGLNTVIQIGGSTFYIGYLISKYNILKKMKLYMLLFLPVFGMICYILNDCHINYVNYQYGNYWLTVLTGISISLIIIYISYLIVTNKMLEYIGKNTMGLLIFHKIIIIIFQTKMGQISKMLKDSNLIIELFMSIIVTSLSILISLIITKLIRKKFPFLIGEKPNKKTINQTLENGKGLL